MSKRSENPCEGKPELADRFRAAAEVLAANGTFLLDVFGLRTGAKQYALYAQGRTTTGHIITNARAGQSMHNYGLALNVGQYPQGERERWP